MVYKKVDGLMVVDYSNRICDEKSPIRNKIDLQKVDKFSNILELLQKR
jgi:hypothetical protein